MIAVFTCENFDRQLYCWKLIPDDQANRDLLLKQAAEVGTPKDQDWSATERLELLLRDTAAIDPKEVVNCSACFHFVYEW